MSENYEDQSLNSLKCIDNSRDSVLHKMYVSNVGNRLREMQTPSDIDCMRWPWELMQNAKDSISGSERESVEVKLKINDDMVIFQHNGCPFNGKTYLALLYKYSEGKENNTESTGRFGTGFLTTHSLSKVVKMEGPIKDEDGTVCAFEVTMYRDGKNNEELIEGMKKMEKEKKFWKNKDPIWTKFKYILKTKRNKESSELGSYSFKINIILTMLFNQKFKKVELKSKDTNLIYEKKQEQLKEENNNVEIISYTLKDTNTNELKARSFLHSKINEKSKELTDHFDKERFLSVECALEINPIQKLIICEEKSPCLFCSLPLVGSETHILPFILNSNDFEPSTERQEILLDGAEIKFDEKRNNKEIPSDVGINRYILRKSYELFERIVKYCSNNKYNDLHLLARGLKNIPNVKKYFDRKWYEENYMKNMRDILEKFPIIYNVNNELSLIKDIYFPIYDIYNENYTKTFYKLIKELYISVPRYEESIQWSKYLWEKGLEKNRINIDKLINKYNETQHDIEFNNCFIKFIWDYYKEKATTKKVLINQENKYILYNEKEFAQSKDVSEDMINCIEELGNNWRINHLSDKITSIELPIKHDISYAINMIKKSIDNDKEKSFILARYVEKNNSKRENLYYFSKLLYNNKVGEKYIIENFSEEIYKDSDEFIIEKMIITCEKWENYSNVSISLEDFNKLMNFLYLNNEKIFEEKKLLPSIKGDFNYIKNLYMENNINEQIKEAAKKYINLKYDEQILNHKIEINNLNIKKYGIDDILNEINQFLNTRDFNENKLNISKIMINFLPDLESNDTNDNIIKKHNDIREIYSKIDKNELNKIKLKTQVNSIWESIDKYILIYLQKKLDNKKDISIVNNSDNINEYIDILNKYQEYFDFEKYNIIPNSYGKFLKINELEDYNDIPEDILKGIKNIFLKDLKLKSIYKGIKINGIKYISMHDIGEIIEKCFENKKNEDRRSSYQSKYVYTYTYEICKIIIKYIPLKGRKRDEQLRLYNLYKLFDKEIEEPIDINSYENLYTDVNIGIIQYINEKINSCKNVKETEKYTNDIFKLINEYSDIFHPDEYRIIPNQLGELKKLDELSKDNDILEELKNILPEKYDVKGQLMDKRIIKFNPNKIINNDDIKNKINNLIEKGKLNITKTLKLIPKNDDGNKQKDIKSIYEIICNDGKKLKEIEIDLESTFWNVTNKYALKKIIDSFKKITKLKDIDEDEDKALRILETLYKYIPPELKENEKLKIVPNQYGKLLGYNELCEEKELNQNFKNMMKKLFDYDISSYLKHKKLNYYISKTLSINEDIIQKINDGFKDSQKKLKEKAKEFIKFYPKNEEDNYIVKFIDSYKALSGEIFNEEQINTNNINAWEKAVKILLKELLIIIKRDKTISKTSERIKLDEDETIKKLNIFYSILFRFDVKEKIKSFEFIPNEEGIYKKLEDIYCNKDIDNEIKDILTNINEELSYDRILIHHKVNLTINHSEKNLEDIARNIDKEIERQYSIIDKNIQKDKENVKIEDKFQKSCKLLLQKWFKEHKDKIDLFNFTKSHLIDISVKILFDDRIKKILEDLLINDPSSLLEILKFQDPNAPFFYCDESFIEDNDDSESSSFDATLDSSINQNQNNFNFNLYNYNNNINYNNYNNNNHHRRRRQRNRNYYYFFGNSIRNRYEEGIKRYCKAQAYVYAKLVDSHLFKEIDWKNKLNENEEGELIIISNNLRYKVRKSYSNYDFIIKTFNNKTYKISVKNGETAEGSDLKFNFGYSQWNTLNNELKSIVFAFVSLRSEINPDIYFSKNILLDEL